MYTQFCAARNDVGQCLSVGEDRAGCGEPFGRVVRERNTAVGSACCMYWSSSFVFWKSVSVCSCPGMSCSSIFMRYWPFLPSEWPWGSDKDERADDAEEILVCVLLSLGVWFCINVDDLSSLDCAVSPSEESSAQV